MQTGIVKEEPPKMGNKFISQGKPQELNAKLILMQFQIKTECVRPALIFPYNMIITQVTPY